MVLKEGKGEVRVVDEGSVIVDKSKVVVEDP